jgi:hypothetical protein
VIKFTDYKAYADQTGVIASNEKMQLLEHIESKDKLKILVGAALKNKSVVDSSR